MLAHGNPPGGRRPAEVPEATRLESDDEIRQAILARRARLANKEGVAQQDSTAAASAEADVQSERPTRRPPMALLGILDDGKLEGEWLRLRAERTVLGRTEGDILIPHDGMISSRHAELTRQHASTGWRGCSRSMRAKHGKKGSVCGGATPGLCCGARKGRRFSRQRRCPSRDHAVPVSFVGKAASMTQSSVSTPVLATLLLQQLQAVLALSTEPCRLLHAQIAALSARFLAAPLTPAATCDFETQLRQLLDECGRLVVQTLFNHLEPDNPLDAPKHLQHDGYDYSRKNHKSRTRGGLATLFGPIERQRCLYEPWQEARADGQRCLAPVELSLGIVAHNATPALAERVGRLATQYTQQQLLDVLRSEHHVTWSVAVLRQVSAAVSAGIAPYLRSAQQQAVLGWLAQASRRRGRRRLVLAVGRDGLMLPLRHEDHYKEGGVATLSVYDRRGRRLGTVYLGEMPEAKQLTLTAELTALLQAVLGAWQGPPPRLVYLTDAGYHQTTYFKDVLSQMADPRRPGQRLQWLWIIDDYHAAGYVSQLAQVLFHEEPTRQAWARRMRRVLRDQDRGVIRVLHSAAQYYGRKTWSAAQEKDYQEAYGYLRKHSPEMKYSAYRGAGLPIGSGVTEAGCKVVFTQRFKQSGMTWQREGGEVILRLRLAELSGVWEEVYREYLKHRPLVAGATPQAASPQTAEKAA